MRSAVVILILGASIGGLFWIRSHNHHQHVEDERTYQEQPTATTSAAALRIPILIYHSVRPDYIGETLGQKAFSITPELFEKQLQYLHDNGFTVISLDDLAHDLDVGTTSPVAKPVVITFDDGWRNQYEYAFPLLKKHNLKATFFVYTKPIDHYPHFLTWNQLKEMQEAGMTIGDHTVTHPYLSKLTDDELRYEVLEGKKELEAHLGVTVRHFASPFGYTSPELVSVLKDGGFTTGRTTYRGAYHDKGQELQLKGFLVGRSMHDFDYLLNYAP